VAAKLPIPNLTFSPLGTGGLAVPGGVLYSYVAGSLTPQNTFTDETGVSANTNPVILDSTGNANVWLTPGVSYRFDLYDSSGVLLRTVDNVPGGTLAGQSSVTANYVFAGPTSGGAAAPAFRALVAADVPTLTGYAMAALDNLASVNVNTSLLAQTGVDLGSTVKSFRSVFLWGSGTFGSTSIQLTGTPTGARVLTLPNATDTLVGRNTTDTLTNKTIDTASNTLDIAGVAVTANTGTGAMVRTTSPTIVTPTIASFANATHTHQSVAGGGLLPPLKYPVNILSIDGAIDPHTAAFYVITKGSAAALTLAAPTATTDDGLQIVITSNSAFAHVITATGLLQTGAATVNTATTSVFAGASLTLIAYQGKWNVVSQNTITFA